ncbi:MAG TPA: VanZ family protein [Anaerolineales bacterium]|nr:VanZ family protein [Anaerolineales bacterium]HND47105.1 VanZ family protein [Anaerolineales bacterium]HNE05867.1 VanZ family protein [Anaerolineales bacterium]HNF94403.1 VanZ family protein [Anaerolineales bacterium]HNM37591.1 VanZ family protein [Anaerolineales bacterium]
MKYLAILFTLFILAIIILADKNALPPFIHAIYDFPNGDKAGHFILFGLLNFILTLTFLRALPNRTRSRVALSVGLILALAITLEEFSQRYFSSRTFDLIDLTASYIGVLVGGWIAFRIKK